MAKKKTTTSKKSTKTSRKADQKKNKKQSDPAAVLTDNITFELTIPAATTKRAYQQILQKNAKTATAKGFRKGKVPIHMVEEIVGRDKLVQQTLGQILPAAYQRHLNKSEYKPVTEPEFDLIEANPDQDWKVEVTIAEKPTVKLSKNYQKVIKTAKKEAQKKIKKHQAELEKHKQQDKASSSDHDGHQDQDLTNHQKQDMTLQTIFRALLDEMQPQIPQLLLKNDTHKQIEALVNRVEQAGLTLDEYLERRQLTFDQLSSQIAAQALASLQLEFILEAIREDEELAVTDEEVSKALEERAKAGQIDVENPHVRQYMERNLEQRKIIDYLLEL